MWSEHTRQKPPKRQQGAALLVLLTLVVLVGAGLLLEGLNRSTDNQVAAEAHTMRALAEAKAALVGRAVNDANRPGSLPCPDTDNDGVAELFAGIQCPSYIGRLPWKTLRMANILDGSGETLWYALSSSFRDHGSAEPINSETLGLISVNGAAGMVAAIIAPGAPVVAQQNRTSNNDDDYLEGENANDDLVFINAVRSNTFNDRVMPIAQTDVMPLVERRILGEVGQVLRTFRDGKWSPWNEAAAWNPVDPDDTWNNRELYPWLSPFGAGPVASVYNGAVGTREGLLPFSWPGEQFFTTFKAKWNINNADTTVSGTVTLGELEVGDITFNGTSTQCTWTTIEQVNCNVTALAGQPGNPGLLTCLGEPNTQINRKFEFVFTADSGDPDGVKIKRPKWDKHRERDLKINTTPFPITSNVLVRITDIAVSGPQSGNQCGQGTLVDDADTGGEIEGKKIQFDLGVPDELPLWLVSNNWHQLLYVAASSIHVGDGSGAPPPVPCAPGTDCLTLVGTTASNAVQAIVVSAGAQLAGQNRVTGTLGSYYEFDPNHALQPLVGNDTAGDDEFVRLRRTNAFNDQVHIIAP